MEELLDRLRIAAEKARLIAVEFGAQGDIAACSQMHHCIMGIEDSVNRADIARTRNNQFKASKAKPPF